MKSIMNNLMEKSNQSQPFTGQGATILMFSDRQAATVVDVTNNIVTVQEDSVARTDNNGMSESQEYEYTPNPNGQKHFFKFKGNKVYKVAFNEETKRWNKISQSEGLLLGVRKHYYDFSF